MDKVSCQECDVVYHGLYARQSLTRHIRKKHKLNSRRVYATASETVVKSEGALAETQPDLDDVSEASLNLEELLSLDEFLENDRDQGLINYLATLPILDYPLPLPAPGTSSAVHDVLEGTCPEAAMVSSNAPFDGVQPLWPDVFDTLAAYAHAYVPICSLERFVEIVSKEIPGCPSWAPRMLYKRLRPDGPLNAKGGTEVDAIVLE